MKIYKLVAVSLALVAAFTSQAFTSRDVSIYNRADSVTLAGTLTMPDDVAPCAAIVMITGSGAQDRDETVFGHKPFKTIAEYLSGHGYAVLRTDDRGIGESSGSREDVTGASNMRDAEASLHWLAEQYPDMPVGLIGHSEGGQIAYRVAADPQCRFIVTLAAPSWRGDSLLMAQSRAIAVATIGSWPGERLQRTLVTTAASHTPVYAARVIMLSALSESLGGQTLLPQVQEQLGRQVDGMLSPWYREFLRYDPADDIKAVAVPWLALNGSKDLQVPPENLDNISCLNPMAETKVMDGLNHLFQSAVTGLPQEYASISGDVTDETLEVILKWLRDNVGCAEASADGKNTNN